MNSRIEASSSRPSRDFPLAFSTRTTAQPAFRSAAAWIDVSWSLLLTRA
jgi:hypothetical protein